MKKIQTHIFLWVFLLGVIFQAKASQNFYAVPLKICCFGESKTVSDSGKQGVAFYQSIRRFDNINQKAWKGILKARSKVVGAVKKGTKVAQTATTAARRGAKLSSSQNRAIKGLRDQISKHQQKLKNYIANPDKFDNRGILRAASKQQREKIIASRIKNLEKQITTFEKDIKGIKSGTKKVLGTR